MPVRIPQRRVSSSRSQLLPLANTGAVRFSAVLFWLALGATLPAFLTLSATAAEEAPAAPAAATSPAPADKPAEAGMRNDYVNGRFRLFRGDRFLSEIAAKTASATHLDQKDPKVEMTGVTIEIYDSQYQSTADEKPPVKARITSDRGVYMRALDTETRQMQDIAILEGNVVVHRYLPRKNPDEKPELESTILCDQASWNNSTGVLNGSGQVAMVREDGTLKLNGEGMIYEIDRTKQNELDLDNEQNQLGGILELQRNVRMELLQKDKTGRPRPDTRTTITSRGAGRYDFDHHEMNFSNTVNVVRSNMSIACEKLRVLLSESESAAQRFREMVAESAPTGVVHIRGKGNPNDPGQKNLGEWSATARYARYKDETGELLLTDDRPDFVPSAQLENNIIRNSTIIFFIREERLFATGKNGETILNSDAAGSAAPATEADAGNEKITIRYADKLFFDQKRSVAQFNGAVKLIASGLEMDSEKLEVDFTPASLDGATTGSAAGRVKKVTASENVRLVYQKRKARCAVLEILPNLDKKALADSKGNVLVDQFIMSGAPMPEIEIPGGYFQARQINTTRLKKISTGKKLVIINAIGPGSGLFGGSADNSGLSNVPGADATTIRYTDKMIYSELEDTIDFYGEVTATRGDQVLRSDRLLAWLVNSAGSSDQDRKEIQRLMAIGNANMHWGLHHCEADSIDRQMPAGGRKVSDAVILTGKSDRPARIWEENGASFQGPQITAAADGSIIYSRGGGELMMMDRNTNEKAMVLYSGDAYYKVLNDQSSYAIFRKNVILKRGNMKVTGDRMRADLVAVKSPASSGPVPDLESVANQSASTATLPRRLKRVTIEENVVIRQGNRVAFGTKGQVDIADQGDIMLLEGGKERAEVSDNNGFTLFAPRIMVKEAAGIITASGPGEVRINGTGSAKDAGVDTSLLATGGKDKYQLLYKGKLLYNTLLRKIRFEDDVRMIQDTLYGSCDSLMVYLNKGPTGGEDNTPIQVETVEAFGKVRFTRLPEPPAGRDPYDLPGRTILASSKEAHYEANNNLILLNSPGGKSAIIVQESPPGSPKQRYRQTAERIWINTASGQIDAPGQEIVPLPGNGPLRFPDES